MKSYYYRVVIAYNGSNYFGWQDLSEEETKPTVQGTITQALRKICKYAECTVSGASRTDAGVHALGQVAKLTVPLDISPEKLQLGLNSLLPEDIRIRQCVSCQSDFNPNKHASGKKYRYYFSIDSVCSPMLQPIVAHVPARLEGSDAGRDLDLKRMRQACELFLGEHDFYSFAGRDKNVESTVRNITSLQLVKTGALDLGGEVYFFEVEGDGFLKHMVRYIVGTIIDAGRHAISLEDIAQTLGEREEEKLSRRAKARGLHLIEINY
ncbi:MAG: tRNA pseudouridine synthase A [Pseudohongiella sp.]|nr:MAG: tRNA pseudouridine synthase A [Pseudohongiella sp.]